VLETSFNSLFVLELVLRMLAEEGSFCFGAEWHWNLFDTVVVSVSVVEMSWLILGFSPSYLRLLRLAKIVRPMRMLRLFRFVPLNNKLHALTLAFARCRAMLVCAILCLCLMVFVFSIVFSSAVAAYISDAEQTNIYVTDLQTFFGTLLMTMLTLFMAISGGIDWWDICKLLMEVGVVYLLIFLVYIVIAVLAVLNVINAIFVNDAVDATQRDLDLRSQAELAENRVMLRRLATIFQHMEKDRRGVVSCEAFVGHMGNEEMKNQLSLLGLDWIDGVALFRFLDVDQRNYLTIDEFVMGCLRLKGEAILVDMDVEIKETKHLLMDIHNSLMNNAAKDQSSESSKISSSLLTSTTSNTTSTSQSAYAPHRSE